MSAANAVTEAMVAPLIEALHALGYPPIRHADARKALEAALAASPTAQPDGEPEPWVYACRVHYLVSDDGEPLDEVPSDWWLRFPGDGLPESDKDVRAEIVPLYQYAARSLAGERTASGDASEVTP